MSYCLERPGPLPAEIQRIAREQIEAAVASLEDPQDPDESIHDARKRFKKVRAVLRLVRIDIGPEVFQRENSFFRDLGRRLAPLRESAVRVSTLDRLQGRYEEVLAPEAFNRLRESLVEGHRQVSHRLLNYENVVREVSEEAESALMRVASWPISAEGFDALRGGLRKVYKRGRNRMADAYRDRSPEGFHDWRKRVKYLWYHMRILEPAWPQVLEPLADYLHDLAEDLGDSHDLADLARYLRRHPDLVGDRKAGEALLALLDRQREELEDRARPLGRRIYAEKPTQFISRMEQFWGVWQVQTEN